MARAEFLPGFLCVADIAVNTGVLCAYIYKVCFLSKASGRRSTGAERLERLAKTGGYILWGNGYGRKKYWFERRKKLR